MDDNVVNRVIPHSTEAEQSVIGAMMVDNEVISVAADLITGSDFYNKQYGIIFSSESLSKILYKFCMADTGVIL